MSFGGKEDKSAADNAEPEKTRFETLKEYPCGCASVKIGNWTGMRMHPECEKHRPNPRGYVG
jgi:hypothetical protein